MSKREVAKTKLRYMLHERVNTMVDEIFREHRSLPGIVDLVITSYHSYPYVDRVQTLNQYEELIPHEDGEWHVEESDYTVQNIVDKPHALP